MIGALGSSIIFETSDARVLTFGNLQRTVASKWANHALIGRKAKSEYLGMELDQISFDIKLNAALGVRPRAVLQAIEDMIAAASAEILIIGDAPIGDNPWKILSVSEAWNVIYNRGELFAASLTLTLEEYL